MGDGSDQDILNRLFQKAFAQYWMIQWCHEGYENLRPFSAELDAALMLWNDSLSTIDGDEAGSSSITTNMPVTTNSSIENERLAKIRALDQLDKAFRIIAIGSDALSLLSSNDELEDIHTESLKYLMLPYLSASVTVQKPDMAHRPNILRRAVVYITEFMNTLSRLGILEESQAKYWDRGLGEVPTGRRNFKIEATRHQTELLNILRPLLNSAEAVERFIAEANSNSKDEETARSHMMSILHLFSSDAISLYDMIQTEIPMLERFMNERATGKQEESRPVPRSKPWTIHVDGVSKLDPTTIHFLYKKLVFMPGHNLPEISLDECARLEMEMDVKLIGSKANDKGNKPQSECSDDSERSESEYTDDSRDDEEVAKEKAKWDDWKDDHPRGSGNKNRNVG
ncbi:TAP42-like family protein [Babesia bovis T2Bo]|uniref:TAP42-like family protein n=1 Tax=Babesia bovis TaxID=5865 RepID=A7AV65_BABBO|nr:TAP42-like family protein [Babesia bovis T2Bo]EDO05691.1 TAP42-like family protein [Babesia bovis T2Bo]|eukprot:XP_001609259.1 hypothetical protein [Babesia bovis T2Bo]